MICCPLLHFMKRPSDPLQWFSRGILKVHRGVKRSFQGCWANGGWVATQWSHIDVSGDADINKGRFLILITEAIMSLAQLAQLNVLLEHQRWRSVQLVVNEVYSTDMMAGKLDKWMYCNEWPGFGIVESFMDPFLLWFTVCADREQLPQCLLYDEYSDEGGWDGFYTQPDQSSNAGVCLMRTSAMYSLM